MGAGCRRSDPHEGERHKRILRIGAPRSLTGLNAPTVRELGSENLNQQGRR
jgi:hypothetical protein